MNVMNAIPARISPALICATLIVSKEMLAATLLSVHNLHTLIQLSRDMRQAILENRFAAFAEQFFVHWQV